MVVPDPRNQHKPFLRQQSAQFICNGGEPAIQQFRIGGEGRNLHRDIAAHRFANRLGALFCLHFNCRDAHIAGLIDA